MKMLKLTVAMATLLLCSLTAFAQSESRNGYAYRKVNVTGPYPGLTARLTNAQNIAVTNMIFKIPSGQPVSFSPLFVNSAISNVTYFLSLSFSGTNAEDFATSSPLIARFPGTATGSVHPFTNFTAAMLGGAFYIKLNSISNDAGAGLTSNTIYPTNAVLSANSGPQ